MCSLITCSITNSSAAEGGALAFTGNSVAHLTSCTFYNSSAVIRGIGHASGGALLFDTNSVGYLTNCTIIDSSVASPGQSALSSVRWHEGR